MVRLALRARLVHRDKPVTRVTPVQLGQQARLEAASLPPDDTKDIASMKLRAASGDTDE
jgi:hypothetical protein